VRLLFTQGSARGLDHYDLIVPDITAGSSTGRQGNRSRRGGRGAR
jgi:hypothetical protein